MNLFDCLPEPETLPPRAPACGKPRRCPWCGYKLDDDKYHCDETCEFLDLKNPE